MQIIALIFLCILRFIRTLDVVLLNCFLSIVDIKYTQYKYNSTCMKRRLIINFNILVFCCMILKYLKELRIYKFNKLIITILFSKIEIKICENLWNSVKIFLDDIFLSERWKVVFLNLNSWFKINIGSKKSC